MLPVLAEIIIEYGSSRISGRTMKQYRSRKADFSVAVAGSEVSVTRLPRLENASGPRHIIVENTNARNGIRKIILLSLHNDSVKITEVVET